MNGFTLSPSSTLKRLHYENQMPNTKCWTQVTFKDKGHTSKTRPLTTLGAFSPCSLSEGSSCPTRSSSPTSFRSILAQGARATPRAAVGVAQQPLTAVKSEDERTSKGKLQLAADRRSNFQRFVTIKPRNGSRRRESHHFQNVIISVAAG